MKKLKLNILLVFSLVIYSCNKDYPSGGFGAFLEKDYFLNEIVDKSTFKITKISEVNNFPKLKMGGFNGIGFTFYKSKKDSISYSAFINKNLTSYSTKTSKRNRDFFYEMNDIITYKLYSIRVRGNDENYDIETSNIIEGKYDITKDTLIFRYKDAGGNGI